MCKDVTVADAIHTKEEQIMSKLEEALCAVALSRKVLQEERTRLEAIQARIDATEDGQTLAVGKGAMAGLKAAVARDEAHAREQAAVAFALTGDKRPATGASIRMTKIVHVTGGPEAVKAWAIEHAPHVLTVHEPTLRKQILAGGVPEELATIQEEPRGVLSRDLSEWLDSAPEELPCSSTPQ